MPLADPLFHALFERGLDPILIADDEARYVDGNPAACELLGVPREDIAGLRVHDVSPAPPAEVDAMWRTFLRAGSAEGEFEIRRRSGDLRICDFRATAHVLPGRHVSFMRDVTDRRRAEDARAEDERMRELFVGVLGHDLRNPLSAVLTGAELLLEQGGERPADVRRTAARIAASATRMARMIDDLLDLTRVRAGQPLPLAARTADLAELCHAVIGELELTHPGRIRWTRPAPAVTTIDPGRVAQAISNLVGNALRHGGGGPVEVELDATPAQVSIRVHNGGPAIPADEQARIFDPFRVGRAGRAGGGLGLGLYITRQVALAHGGVLRLRSAPDAGTTFWLDLPRR